MTHELLPVLADLPLVDHHCHGVESGELDRDRFERALTEAETVSPLGTTLFDSLIGLAVRRWCAPLLDLPRHAPAEDYLARRSALGAAEVNRRLVRAAGIGEFLLDDGLLSPTATTPAELATLAGGRTRRIVRLEQVAEDVLRGGVGPADFADAVRAELARRARAAVGVKSVAAYRVGLALSGARPTEAEVRIAAERCLAAGSPTLRIAHETVHRFLIWSAIDLGKPVQFHIGLGDADVHLHRCDPLLLTDLLRATRPTGVPIVLLHNYPYHRNAAYLAQVFEHVFLDLSLTLHNVGHRAGAVLAETLELAPFGKFLFASDAFALAELYHLGAVLFRHGLSDFLRAGIADDAWTTADAERIATMIGADNARRVYQLD
ncbi:MAG TPA: amidohydrolase family protein [Pseudonocardiaceae bacterium]|nr:amidohydrolase family protein [Pseudonocardiaceae bacterium]